MITTPERETAIMTWSVDMMLAHVPVTFFEPRQMELVILLMKQAYNSGALRSNALAMSLIKGVTNENQ